MFERFSDNARQVVVGAQEEARALRHNYIGTEHILLGLLRDEQGIPARALSTFGVNLEGVRTQVARIIGQGEEVGAGQIPFTPRAKKVLELALREALGLGHNHIGPEHVLLGVARENDGVAARILLHFDADADSVRDVVIRELGITPRPAVQARRRAKALAPHLLVTVGWLLFAGALGIGILIGWGIWGLGHP